MRNEELYKKIKSNWDNLSKPLDGLGEFETVLSRIGAIQGSENIALFPSTLLIFIAVFLFNYIVFVRKNKK